MKRVVKKIKIPFIVFSFFFGSFYLLGCINQTKNAEKKIDNRNDVVRDSVIYNMLKRYPDYPQDFKINKSDTVYQRNFWCLEKSISLNGYLTIQHLFLYQSYYFDFHLLYVFNDSFHFALPLIDSYYYRIIGSQRANKEYDANYDTSELKGYEKKLCLETELNKLLKLAKIENKKEATSYLLKEIMSVGYDFREVNKYDFVSLRACMNDLINEKYTYSHCKKTGIQNIDLVEKLTQDESYKAFTDGITIYLFHLPSVESNQTGITLQVFNYDCKIEIRI